jgi:hypothetical protein
VEVKEIMQNGVRSRALSSWLLATVCILAAAVSAAAVKVEHYSERGFFRCFWRHVHNCAALAIVESQRDRMIAR